MKACCKAYLDEQFGGDPDITREIYGEYVSSMNSKIPEIERAIASAQWDAVDKLAHTVKGNALQAGDSEMAAVAIEMRKTAALAEASLLSGLLMQMKKLAESL